MRCVLGRLRERIDPDRYISWIAGNAYYKRRVPLSVAHLDDRAPVVRSSMKTSDIKLARKKRDLLEAADDGFWSSLASDLPIDPARRRFDAAVRRVEALDFTFYSAAELERGANDEVVRRLETAMEHPGSDQVAASLLGTLAVPKTTVREAFDIYCDEIVADELLGKSETQRAQWKKVKLRAVNNFVSLVSDKPMVDITRDDAKKIYKHWLARIVPKKGEKSTAGASSGNRDLGNMRVLYAAYFRHMGDSRRENPFESLGFAERKKRSRPPIPTQWITEKVLAPGALATLNAEARAILLIMIETGARPSEIANQDATTMRVSAEVPYLAIEPREDPDDPREIKTESARRSVPLVGVALEAARAHPQGFPRYRNRENDLSAVINKFFKENNLFPTPAHKVYSFRHAYEDRMKEGNLDVELRKIILGHTIDRPKYGSGGALAWRRDEMLKIALPFDPSIV